MNLVEIHEEISELLHKQVNVQIEYLSRGSRKPTEAPRKVCDENGDGGGGGEE